MNFRPLHDRVLVRRLDTEEKTAGGIIIPDTAQEKPQEGQIVAVGNGTKSEDGKVTPLDLKVGDIVLFGKWSGTEVKVDGEELCIMKESDIMGIITTKSKAKSKRKIKFQLEKFILVNGVDVKKQHLLPLKNMKLKIF